MEANKENENRFKGSKIPLPVLPLPAIPKHLVESKNKKEIQHERYPLRTLNTHPNLSLAGPSKIKPIPKIVTDTRHVTLRHKEDDLDWDYKVFKDNSNKSVIVISDDEDDGNSKVCVEGKTAATPALKSLEPNRIKKIKRSLTRPHSRELQGLSPLVKDVKNGEGKARRRLLFQDTLEVRLRTLDFWKKSYMKCLSRDYTTDMFEYLMESEQRSPVPMISSMLRACVINWLMKINTADGNPAIVQSACWYLDAVLATGQVQVDKLQLIGAACFWIAHKLHGPGIIATMLVKYSNHAFSAESLLFAEKVILERLKFPRQPVIPQEYICYLSWWCDHEHPGEIEAGATFLYMCGLMVDKSLCGGCPSVIAVAAVQNSLLLLGKTDLMIQFHNCPVYKAVQKKVTSLSNTCALLRRAARTVASLHYEYKAPFEQYGVPPHYIAQIILNAANELSVPDAKKNTTLNMEE